MDDKEKVIKFMQDVQLEFEGFCTRLNGGTALEKRSWDSCLGPLNVTVSRGPVFEKASYVYCDLEIDTPPVLAKQWGYTDEKMKALVLEIGIHPANPRIPKSYMELRANIAGRVALAGGTDLFPYLPASEDETLFADQIRLACQRHGQDYEDLRGVRADFFKSKYSDQTVGSHAGIYFFHLESDQFEFFKDMSETFFKAYEEIVLRRKDEPFTAEDREHQLKLHGQWAQWILLEDEGTRFGLEKGIPPEALLGAILPPLAKF